MKKIIASVALIIAASFLLWFFVFNQKAEAPEQPDQATEQSDVAEQPQGFDKTQYSTDEVDSIWQVINKTRPIDLSYIPVDLVDVNVTKRDDKSAEELMLRQEAATALETMFVAAKVDGIDLMLGSAYRSAALQETYYSNYVTNFGQEEASKFSAKPGTSEHQIGLAADLSSVDKTCYLEICFSETPEGQWIAVNAHKHGFIIRYLKGKEDVTGYQYEPWHVRYVGQNLAAAIYKTQQTMEEFFGL